MTDSAFEANRSESLYATFQRRWEPAAPFLETRGGGRWSYHDLDQVTAGLAKRMRALGLRRGDRLVCQLDRSPFALFLYLSALRAGLTYVPVSPQLTDAELQPLLSEVEPSLFVCRPQSEASLSLLPATRSVRILTLDVDGSGSLADVPANDIDPDVAVRSDDPAAIVFTSGTTGRPKGVVLPHGHLVAKADALAQALGWRSSDKLLHTMPLYHAHGLFMTTHCIMSAGASMFMMPRFEAAEVVAALPLVTAFSGVPTMYSRMLAVPSLAANARGVRLFVSASAPLPAPVFKMFRDVAGHSIVECWGMSETMTNTAHTSGSRPGTVGKPIPTVEVRAMDQDGTVLPPGQPGQLEVRSPTRFSGYWRQADTVDLLRDGFFRTGDIGFIDADGYVTIVGRTSDVIITGGYNVHPKEIELALERRDDVSRAAVFGVPHPDYGEAILAAVETSARSFDPRQILSEMKQSLVGYKIPKALFAVDRLPVTELGKIQRSVLSERFRDHFSLPDRARDRRAP